MTTAAIVAIILGTCLAGFVQGVSGFAFGLVAMSVWAWTIDPQLAGPMVVWGSWVGQILSLGALRGGLLWRRAVPFVIGGAAGVPLGAWVLKKACADATKWPAHLTVSVNVSPLQLAQPNLLQVVQGALTESTLLAKRL